MHVILYIERLDYNKEGFLASISGNILNGSQLDYSGGYPPSIGIALIRSTLITLSNNQMSDCGAMLSSSSLESLFSISIESTNYVNEKPLVCYVNETALGPLNFTNFGQLILINCSNSLISNLEVSFAPYPISLYYCNHNTRKI